MHIVQRFTSLLIPSANEFSVVIAALYEPCPNFIIDQPRGLVVRASGYKSRGPGFDSRLYHGDFPCGGRIPVVTMVWVVSRIRFKVETSITRSHTSING